MKVWIESCAIVPISTLVEAATEADAIEIAKSRPVGGPNGVCLNVEMLSLGSASEGWTFDGGAYLDEHDILVKRDS